jgi:multimeric flavodoxin WrbA
MITSFLLKAFHALVYIMLYPIRLLPDVDLTGNIGSAITTAGSYLSGLNDIIPIGTILAAIGLILVVEGAIFVYKGVNWLIRKIPGVN